MTEQKLKVVLLFGGRSPEHEVSLTSAASIYKNLDKGKFSVSSIYINKEGKWRTVESPLLSSSELKHGKFFSFLPWGKSSLTQTIDGDIYFPILHGPYGEDGTIQGLFELADVPYVGATVMASAVAMDKAVTKTILKAKKIPVVKYMIVFEQDWRRKRKVVFNKIIKELPLPFFIKPANLGSSIGITKVKDYSEIESALETAFRYDRKILIEEGIAGRDLECSVLGNDNPRASLPGEIIPYREFYDYRDKYVEGKTRFAIPATLPSCITEEIQKISIQAYKIIGCSGMARVDFFYQEKTKDLFLNEINTIPGFTKISMYPKLWEVSGIPFPKLLEKLIELGLERHNKKKKNITEFIK